MIVNIFGGLTFGCKWKRVCSLLNVTCLGYCELIIHAELFFFFSSAVGSAVFFVWMSVGRLVSRFVLGRFGKLSFPASFVLVISSEFGSHVHTVWENGW